MIQYLGRENCIVNHLQQSPHVRGIFVCPGNYGTSNHNRNNYLKDSVNIAWVENVNIQAEELNDIVQFSLAMKIRLVVVGNPVLWY